MLEIKVEQFEGPLDLLLQLIEEEKLDITEVSLAKVTDQYLSRLESLAHEMRLDEIANFLVVAAKLLLIKSKMLLPYLTAEEEDEIDDLARQLKIYQEYAVAAKQIGAMYLSPTRSFVRPPVTDVAMFAPPKKVSPELLSSVFTEILARLKPPTVIRKIPIDIKVTVHEKIEALKDVLRIKAAVRFWEFCGQSPSKSEVIASLLATLELVKQRVALVSQADLFSDIDVTLLS